MQSRIYALLCSLALIFSVASCQENEAPVELEPLEKPVVEVTNQGEKTFTIEWNAVENAADYSYVFHDNAEERTNETSITFDKLKPGEYVVRVKANAPEGSKKWKDSNLATITVKLTETYKFEISVTNITYNSANLTVRPSNARITYFYEIGTKENLENLGLTTAEALADYWKEYAEKIGADLSSALVRGTQNVSVRLSSNTEYVAYAFGLKEDGTVTSDLFTYEFTTAVMPDPDPALKAWEGTWAAESAKTLTWTSNSAEAPEVSGVAKTGTFTMTVDPNNPNQLLIYGWTNYSDKTPAVALLNQDKSGIDVYSGVAVGKASGGYTPTWTVWASTDTGSGTFLLGQFAAYSFTDKGDTAEGKPASGQLDNGTKFDAIQMGIYGVAGERVSIIDKEFPVSFMAGNIKLTRTTAEVPVPAAACVGSIHF